MASAQKRPPSDEGKPSAKRGRPETTDEVATRVLGWPLRRVNYSLLVKQPKGRGRRGSYGDVYLMRDTRYCVKVLVGCTPGVFAREMFPSRISSGGVPTLAIDGGVLIPQEVVVSMDDTYYVKLPLVCPLKGNWMNVPAPKKRDVFADIAWALSVLHEHGVAHNDVDPTNLGFVKTVSGDIRGVLYDFSLVAPLGAVMSDVHKEHCRDPRRVKESSNKGDLFGLGCSMVYLMCPETTKNVALLTPDGLLANVPKYLLDQMSSGNLEWMLSIDCGRDLAAVILRCLAGEFESARDCAYALCEDYKPYSLRVDEIAASEPCKVTPHRFKPLSVYGVAGYGPWGGLTDDGCVDPEGALVPVDVLADITAPMTEEVREKVIPCAHYVLQCFIRGLKRSTEVEYDTRGFHDTARLAASVAAARYLSEEVKPSKAESALATVLMNLGCFGVAGDVTWKEKNV